MNLVRIRNQIVEGVPRANERHFNPIDNLNASVGVG